MGNGGGGEGEEKQAVAKNSSIHERRRLLATQERHSFDRLPARLLQRCADQAAHQVVRRESSVVVGQRLVVMGLLAGAPSF